ncbi:MAG: hypothetical protein K9M45_13950 [Kiritimatiellales bacterium]|nr:hypothetical protein [Kiritimatiellales bacterium]
MKRMKTILTVATLLAMGLMGAQAAFRAKVILTSGANWTVNKLVVQDGLILLEGGQIKMPTMNVQMVEFTFGTVNIEKCEQMLREGEYDKLNELLKSNLMPALPFGYLPSNLGDYLIWQLRAQYWGEKYEEVAGTAKLINMIKADKYAAEAHMYHVVALIDGDKLEEAEAAFKELENPDEMSPAMSEYIRARFAEKNKNYREALLHISNVVAFHSRDTEWMPVVTVFEGQIYKKTGYLEAAKNVAEELILGYPDTRWSREGEKLKEGIKE